MRRCLIVFLLALLLIEPLSARNRATVRRFERLTGFPHGRKGYVVDHIIPLCGGGADKVYNLQWQTIAAAKRKDRIEKQQCAVLRAQKKKWPNG